MRQKKRFHRKTILSLGVVILLILSLVVIGMFQDTFSGAATTISKKITSVATMPKMVTKASLTKYTLSTKAVPFDKKLSPTVKRNLARVYCYDRLQTQRPNMAETDVDCGGSLCNKCDLGKHCMIDTDCKTGICQRPLFQPTTETSYRFTSGICVLPSCFDGLQNGQERGVDCGGNCKACTHCVDTDNTREAPQASLAVEGKVTDITGNQGGDSCTSLAGGSEAYCDAKGLLGFSEFTCPPETVCQEGRCTPYTLQICDDPDQNSNDGGIHLATTVVDTQPSFVQDSCFDLRTVNEGKCAANNTATFLIIPCGDREMCQNGACVPITCHDPDYDLTIPEAARLATTTTDTLGGAEADTCFDQDTVL